MNTKFQTLTADELNAVSGGFHISFLDVVTGGLDRVVDYVHQEVTDRISNPSDVESHAFDPINGTPEGDPTDPGNPTAPSNPREGDPFPGDGDD